MFDAGLNCTCNICDCNCTILYYRDHSGKLEIHPQKEREENRSKAKQKKLSAFINFKADVFDISRKNIVKVNDNEQQYDIIDRTTIYIT